MSKIISWLVVAIIVIGLTEPVLAQVINDNEVLSLRVKIDIHTVGDRWNTGVRHVNINNLLIYTDSGNRLSEYHWVDTNTIAGYVPCTLNPRPGEVWDLRIYINWEKFLVDSLRLSTWFPDAQSMGYHAAEILAKDMPLKVNGKYISFQLTDSLIRTGHLRAEYRSEIIAVTPQKIPYKETTVNLDTSNIEFAVRSDTQSILAVAPHDKQVETFLVRINPYTSTINYQFLPVPRMRVLNIYDAMGRKIYTIAIESNQQSASIPFTLLPSGIYIARLNAIAKAFTIKR